MPTRYSASAIIGRSAAGPSAPVAHAHRIPRARSRMSNNNIDCRASSGLTFASAVSTESQSSMHSLPRLSAGYESKLVRSPSQLQFGALPTALPDVPAGRFCKCIVEHPVFRHGITAVIILGIIEMGLATDYTGPGYKRAWQIWEIFYTAICVLEAACMIDAHRCAYFQSGWTILDFLLAVTSVLDVYVFPALGFSHDLGFLRLLRLLRVLRIIKVTKVCPGFAVILEGLLLSFRSMLYIFALLFIILYAASICCVDVLGGKDAGYPLYNDENVRRTVNGWNNFEHFGTLFRSMLTLLGMLLLSEWSMIRPIAELHIVMVPFFLALLVLVSFGVVNVIVGVVVEKTTQAMNEPKFQQIEEEMEEKAALAIALGELLVEIDTDQDGRATLKELEEALSNENFVERLAVLDLPESFTMVEFLTMLDVDGSGALSKHEFVSGLMRLIFCTEWQRDCMHALAIGMVHQSVRRLGVQLQTQLTECRGVITALQSDLHRAMRLKTTRYDGQFATANCMPELRPIEELLNIPDDNRWEPVPEGVSISCIKAQNLSSSLFASVAKDSSTFVPTAQGVANNKIEQLHCSPSAVHSDHCLHDNQAQAHRHDVKHTLGDARLNDSASGATLWRDVDSSSPSKTEIQANDGYRCSTTKGNIIVWI